MHQKQTIEQLLSKRGVQNLLPDDMDEVTVADAEYHGALRREWLEKNQLEAERNQFYHRHVIREAASAAGETAAILELGAGVGYDAKLFMDACKEFKCYILSEISPDLLSYAAETYPEFAKRPVVYCCLDAGHMLIADAQLDVVFMIAALHHLPDLQASLSEFGRVTKPGGRIIFGIEPNRFWMRIMAFFRPMVRGLSKKNHHSAADDEAPGFAFGDFRRIADESGWELEKVVPVWLFAGFLHHGVELLFHLFRMRRRPRLPRALERAVIAVDRLCFCLPLVKRIAWHFTAVYVKRNR